MHRYECNTHNFLFDLENQTWIFLYDISCKEKKINVGKILKLWEICYLIIVSIHIQFQGVTSNKQNKVSEQDPTIVRTSLYVPNKL
jgi:hypothetical protein